MFNLIQKYFVYALLVLLLLAIVTAGWFYIRVGILKNQLETETISLIEAEKAAKTNKETADALQKERDSIVALYVGQLKTCNKKLTALQVIDNTPEVTTHGTTTLTHSGNPLADALNRMFPIQVQADNQDRVHKVSSPASITGTNVLSGEFHYCLNAVNARNLLKNVTVLMRGWGQENYDLLKSFQTGSKQ